MQPAIILLEHNVYIPSTRFKLYCIVLGVIKTSCKIQDSPGILELSYTSRTCLLLSFAKNFWSENIAQSKQLNVFIFTFASHFLSAVCHINGGKRGACNGGSHLIAHFPKEQGETD